MGAEVGEEITRPLTNMGTAWVPALVLACPGCYEDAA